MYVNTCDFYVMHMFDSERVARTCVRSLECVWCVETGVNWSVEYMYINSVTKCVVSTHTQ